MTGRRARKGLPVMAANPAMAGRPGLKRITTPGNDGPILTKDRHVISPGKNMAPRTPREKNGPTTGRYAMTGLHGTAKGPATAGRTSLKRITTPGNDGPILTKDRREISPGVNTAPRTPREKNGPLTDHYARTGLHGTVKGPVTADRPGLKRITTPGNDGPILTKDRHVIYPGENPVLPIPREKNGPMTGRYAMTGLHGTAKGPVTAGRPSLKRITTPGNDGPILTQDRREISPGENPALPIPGKKNGPLTNRHIRAGLQDRQDSRAPETAMTPKRGRRALLRTDSPLPPGQNQAQGEKILRQNSRDPKHGAARKRKNAAAGRRKTDKR